MNTSWPMLSQEVFSCEKCRLCQTRQNVVLGEGDLHAALMFIGEGPGAQEDATGRPFVGAAGQLLDRMLAAIGITREQVYICNIVKCRPPQNRVPEPDERSACMPYLRQQVALPAAVLCCLPMNRHITLPRWFIYGFYPAHLAVLAVLTRML